MAGGLTHELNSHRVTARCMRDHGRGKRAKFAWQRPRAPIHNDMWIRSKFFKHDPQKSRPRNAPVTRHQRPPQCFAAQPGATSLIRDWQAPATYAVVLASE